jgi:NAD(P) transhydrogenase subunit alpha
MSGVGSLYLILLAAVAGYVLIARVPSILHTPMMSGSNFIHGIVLAGAMLALSNADGLIEQVIGFVAVTAAAANVVGGFVVTDRMLAMFDYKSGKGGKGKPPALAGFENPASEDRRLPASRSRRARRPGITTDGPDASRQAAAQSGDKRS